MNGKRLLKALKETIFYSAVIHLILLAIHMVRTGDWTLYNMASIFDMKLYFPEIDYGSVTTAAIAMIPVIALFFWNYFRAGGRTK